MLFLKEIKELCVSFNEKGGQKFASSVNGQIVTNVTGEHFSMDIGECDLKGIKGCKLFLIFVDNGHGECSVIYPLKRATGETISAA